MNYLNNDTATTADDFCMSRLAGHVCGFEAVICAQGYAPASVRRKIREQS
jgi:hypothetical protein